MATSKKLRGDFGEACTANYLRERGYEIVASQYRCRMGEIDLIARKDGTLCFVEVKTRSETEHGLPREFVGPRKQERIRKTAAWYLAVYDLDCPVRFDVAEIYLGSSLDREHTRIEYLEDAFI